MMVTRVVDRNGPKWITWEGKSGSALPVSAHRFRLSFMSRTAFNHIYRDHNNIAQVEKTDSTSRYKLDNDLHHLGLARCEQILGTAQGQPTRRCPRRQTWRRAEHPPYYDKHANTGMSPCHQISPTRHPYVIYLATD